MITDVNTFNNYDKYNKSLLFRLFLIIYIKILYLKYVYYVITIHFICIHYNKCNFIFILL